MDNNCHKPDVVQAFSYVKRISGKYSNYNRRWEKKDQDKTQH